MWKSRNLIGLALLGLLFLLISGCSKVSQSNYDKIENGMTVSQVEAILGKGKEAAGVAGAIGNLTGSGKVLTWGDDKKSITVTFANDKVIAKAGQGL
jgi:outer membrane protein assembly factor BamE (lipoprotein component of BamABCDE complex)